MTSLTEPNHDVARTPPKPNINRSHEQAALLELQSNERVIILCFNSFTLKNVYNLTFFILDAIIL